MPQKARDFAFCEVTGVHAPTGPAVISGAFVKELTMAAVAEPFAAAQKDDRAAGPFHNAAVLPLEGSSVATPASPSTCSVNNSSPEARQKSAVGDDFRPGVAFRAGPPSEGTSQMSPAVEPSSLMMPWITAMVLPSGEKRGQAICSGGFQMDFVSPVPAPIVYSRAIQ